MHYIGFIRLCGFYVDTLVKLGRLAEGTPAVVLDGDVVLDASEQAAKKGIEPGLPAKQARLIEPGATFVDFNPDLFTSQSRLWLDVCALFTDTVEPSRHHAAYVDLSPHPRPGETMVQMIAAVEAHTGLRVAWGAGWSKWLAGLECGERAFVEGGAFVSSLPVRSLPIAREHAAMLENLGYASARDVARFGLRELVEHFGQAGLAIHNAVKGLFTEPVKPLYPADRISGVFRFEGAVSSLASLDNGLTLLSRKLGARLADSDLLGFDLIVVLETEEDIVVRKRTFTHAICCEGSLLSALRMLVGESFCSDVLSIRATIDNLRRKTLRQGVLGSAIAGDKKTSAERAATTIQATLGSSAIKLAANIEEQRRSLVLRAWRNAVER